MSIWDWNFLSFSCKNNDAFLNILIMMNQYLDGIKEGYQAKLHFATHRIKSILIADFSDIFALLCFLQGSSSDLFNQKLNNLIKSYQKSIRNLRLQGIVSHFLK